MPAIFGTANADKIYDFLRPATHIVDVPTEWDDEASKPLTDIDNSCALGRANGHVTMDMAVCGTRALNALINHASVTALADNRRFELIEVGRNPVPPRFQRFVDGGMIPRGRLQTPAGNEIWLFSYLDVYTDADGNAALYMPTDRVVIACSTARCDRYFGPPERLPNIPARDAMYQQLFGFAPSMGPGMPMIKGGAAAVNVNAFYFDAYYSANWKRVTCRTQSAPIFATTQTDAFVTLYDTITGL
jgi:hypothetical protein